MSPSRATPLHSIPATTDPPDYSVLIRTLNSARTLPETLASLEKQTRRPREYVFVDAGSSDNTLSLLPSGSVLHRYIGKEFNFASALNQGITYLSHNYVLIVSSHTSLQNTSAVERAVGLLESNPRIGAAYFSDELSTDLSFELVDRHNFDGWNGLWNTCSLIRVPLLRKRGFRPEVFSAEDQEWARWLLFEEDKMTAKIFGGGMSNVNPRKYSFKKRLNEHLAIAYFTNRKMLQAAHLAHVGYQVIKPERPLRPRERLFHLVLLLRLIGCRFAKPNAKSRYF